MRARDIRPEQKMTVLLSVSNLIKILLKITNCHQHYRVEIHGSDLMVRESTQNPPIERRKQRFEALISILVEKGVFNVADGFLRDRGDNAVVNIPCKVVKNINIPRLFQLLGVDISAKPNNVDEKIWAVIPGEIKSRWSQFSEDMQQHVVTCCAPRAEEGFVDLLQTNIFTQSKRSPITFDVPKIPVRLPNAKLGQSPELYDLLDVVKINQRDPDNPQLRCNPITREAFALRDVIPDRVAYAEILERGGVGGPKG